MFQKGTQDWSEPLNLDSFATTVFGSKSLKRVALAN